MNFKAKWIVSGVLLLDPISGSVFADGRQDVNKAFYAAACAGNVGTLRRLLMKKANIETRQRDPDTWPTPLMCATKMGHYEAVKFLVDSGASIDASDGFASDHAVRLAASEGHFKILQLLVNSGANIDRYVHGGNILMWAAFSGREDSVRLLLSKGAWVNNVSADGVTPLMWAVQCKIGPEEFYKPEKIATEHARITSLLIQRGARINAINNRGLSAMDIAIENKCSDVIDVLKSPPASRPEPDEDLLGFAASGDLKGVKNVLNDGGNINVINSEGDSALILAAGNGHEQVVRFLIDHGANINYRSDPEVSFNALMKAVLGGHAHIVKLLINSGADINSYNVIRGTPAMIARQEEHYEIERILLNAAREVGEQFGRVFSVNNGIVEIISPNLSTLRNGSELVVKNKRGSFVILVTDLLHTKAKAKTKDSKNHKIVKGDKVYLRP